MENIVRTVAEKTGLSEENARMAVEEVVTELHKVLPPQLAPYLDTLLQPAGAGGQQASDDESLGERLSKKFFGNK